MEYKTWLRNKKKYYRGLPIVAGIILIFSTVLIPILKTYLDSETLSQILNDLAKEDNYRLTGHIIHTCFIVFVFFTMQGKYYPVGFGKGIELKKYIAERFGSKSQLSNVQGPYLEEAFNKNLRQFYQLWQAIWVVWFIIYFLLCFQSSISQNFNSNYWFEIIIDTLNIGSSLLMVFMYRILSKKTVKKTPGGVAKGDLFTGRILLLFIALVFANVLVHTFISDHYSFKFWQFVIQLVIGVFVTVSFAAFVGKLNSPFFRAPHSTVIILYVYAAIQMLYIFKNVDFGLGFESHTKIIFTMLTSFAFVCKIVFFYTLSWIMETGRLTYFILCESNLVREEDNNFEAFQNLDITKDRLTSADNEKLEL